MITACSFEQVRDVVELGVIWVFEKPFCIEDLVEAVRSYLYGSYGWAGVGDYLAVA